MIACSPIVAQVASITLFQQFNGQYDLTEVGNTLNRQLILIKTIDASQSENELNI